MQGIKYNNFDTLNKSEEEEELRTKLQKLIKYFYLA